MLHPPIPACRTRIRAATAAAGVECRNGRRAMRPEENLGHPGTEQEMKAYPIKLTYHVRSYYFGERLIPDLLGKKDAPEGIVAETWEISDYKDTTGRVTNGKTEAWHILWAAEGATILAGVKDGLRREEIFEALKAQDYDAVMPRREIRAGDTVYVPGGIIHTFGPDALIFEVQQTSDLGQFVMPEDLYGNHLSEEEWDANIDATLDELKTDYLPCPNPGLPLEDGPNRRVTCCAGPHFAFERWTLTEPYAELAHPERCLTLSSVGDPVRIEHSGGTERLERGESCVLPAAIGEVHLVPEGEASLIACYVPDLERDVVAPLREAGFSDEEIRALGEVGI